jgi:hypothetical protein
MAVGVVSVAVTAGVKLWQDYTTEQENAVRKIRETAIPALSDLRKAFLDARDAAAENAEIQARVRGGGGDIGDIAAVIERTAQQRTQLATELADLNRRRVSELSSADINRIEELNQLIVAADQQVNDLVSRSRRVESQLSENALLDAEQARRRAAIAAMVEEAEGQGRIGATPEGRGGGGGGARREERAYSYDGSGDARRDIERENRWIEKEEQESNARQLEDLNNFLSESADIANYYREREREEEEKQKEALAEIQQKAEDERIEAAKRTKELILETSMESLDTVLSAFDEAATANLEAMLTGGKMTAKATREMVKETMLALTTESIVQGLKQTALGLGALAMGSPSAALHFASAAKFAAVGVAAGVAGAAAGGFSGVGGDSGGGGAPAAATGGPALTPGTAEGAGTTVVINWGSSGLVYAADRAQLGRDISGMISEAHGRLGRGM